MNNTTQRVVYIAVGSNLGNSAKNVIEALRRCQNYLTIKETSFLYKTAPQYVPNQPHFLNAVFKATTQQTPYELLVSLKEVEKQMGRTKENYIRYGPRIIDLDILFFEDWIIESEILTIPHEKIAERDFVLAPFCDIDENFVHPKMKKTIRQLYDELKHEFEFSRVCPIGHFVFEWGSRTFMMGILNITPDSFSDGGDLYNNIPATVSRAKEMAKAGVDIIDIGGQATNPKSKLIDTEEELNRVIPVIQAIRKELPEIPISIDTMNSIVAKKAIEAGANLINDVSGGTFDSDMFRVAAESQTPMVIMHMKGTPQTMTSLNQYSDLIGEINAVLKKQIRLAQQFGLHKWNIIVDPGIGFAKKGEQNLYLLKNLRKVKEEINYPLLVGTSRKKFIGNITGKKEPKSLVMGTAATVAASIAGGADIVRVHDFVEMRDVIKMSDAIWRNNISI